MTNPDGTRRKLQSAADVALVEAEYAAFHEKARRMRAANDAKNEAAKQQRRRRREPGAGGEGDDAQAEEEQEEEGATGRAGGEASSTRPAHWKRPTRGQQRRAKDQPRAKPEGTLGLSLADIVLSGADARGGAGGGVDVDEE